MEIIKFKGKIIKGKIIKVTLNGKKVTAKNYTITEDGIIIFQKPYKPVSNQKITFEIN